MPRAAGRSWLAIVATPVQRVTAVAALAAGISPTMDMVCLPVAVGMDPAGQVDPLDREVAAYLLAGVM